eukprot:scaffold101737_cov61-Phaeocystis_antarctica.AAC.4
MEDEHLDRAHRGQGALARLLRQQVVTLDHGELVWTEPVEQPAMQPSAVECSDQPLLWAGVLWAYYRARREAALPGGALGRWGAGRALGRWGTGVLGRSKRAARTGPTLHRVVALLHAAHLPLRDDVEGVACGAPHGTQYVRHARGWYA